ncbi:MAG: aminotransferase class I/II-fold pyridoxal phosphate-dependent enzyme [Chloroflexota bacterium]|nr:MAG: aminotransferase class I/II-fold pyridoxal phosphate-dependent enzyme [Chloroflexota bacterium]
MIDELKRLESTARLLETDAGQRAQLLQEVIAYSQAYLDGITDSPVYGESDGQALFDSPIGEDGMNIDAALALLRDNVDTSGISTTSGSFLGYIPGGGLFPSALGDYLAAVTNRYAGHFFASPGAVRLENQLLRWMASAVGYPKTAMGNLTSGGSVANLLAIVAARDAHAVAGHRLDRSVIYVTEHVHHSVDKAFHVAGLDGSIRHEVPVDDRYRMDTDALEMAIVSDMMAGLTPWLIVASAGTTNTGSVDPLTEIAEIAANHHLWFHADGAYGAFFALCPEGRSALTGMELSDSLVLDPHKTLFLPYGTGAVLVKDGSKLYSSQNWDAAYMQDIPDDIEEVSPAELSFELTKHFRGLRLWLPLKLYGLAPFRAALSEKILLARYFHREIQRLPGFESGPAPDLSVVIYRYLPARGDADDFNQRLVKRIQKEGRIFISSTRVDGKFVLRLAISSFRTHLEDIDESLEVLKWNAERVLEEDG